MSQRDGFGSGFVIGSIVGGVIGGVLGSLLTNRSQPEESVEERFIEPGEQMPFSTEENMEVARHNLEAKIAQLNSAIDDVRQQLETVNSNSSEQD